MSCGFSNQAIRCCLALLFPQGVTLFPPWHGLASSTAFKAWIAATCACPCCINLWCCWPSWFLPAGATTTTCPTTGTGAGPAPGTTTGAGTRTGITGTCWPTETTQLPLPLLFLLVLHCSCCAMTTGPLITTVGRDRPPLRTAGLLLVPAILVALRPWWVPVELILIVVPGTSPQPQILLLLLLDGKSLSTFCWYMKVFVSGRLQDRGGNSAVQ